MKRQLILSFLLLSSAKLAQADYYIYSGNPNACETISGEWHGKGKGTSWLITCAYTGEGTVSALDSTGNFTMNITGKKRSGDVFCPKEFSQQLNGNCTNGLLVIKTEYGNLDGSFNQDAGEANGKLSTSGVTFKVHIKFQRGE